MEVLSSIEKLTWRREGLFNFGELLHYTSVFLSIRLVIADVQKQDRE